MKRTCTPNQCLDRTWSNMDRSVKKPYYAPTVHSLCTLFVLQQQSYALRNIVPLNDQSSIHGYREAPRTAVNIKLLQEDLEIYKGMIVLKTLNLSLVDVKRLELQLMLAILVLDWTHFQGPLKSFNQSILRSTFEWAFSSTA